MGYVWDIYGTSICMTAGWYLVDPARGKARIVAAWVKQ
jgi:hypothetical protein